MSVAGYVKEFEETIFKAYSGCVTNKMFENLTRDLDKFYKNHHWKLNQSHDGSNVFVYINPAEPLTKIMPPIQNNNHIYLMKDCSAKFLGGHGVPAYMSQEGKPVEYYVSNHVELNDKKSSTPAVSKKRRKDEAGKLKEKSSESPKGSSETKGDKDGHWITTPEGNHVLIEDSMSPQSSGLFTLDPVGMAYSMGITNYTPESDINSIMDANNGWPEVVYCFGKSMRQKDPETERYLS